MPTAIAKRPDLVPKVLLKYTVAMNDIRLVVFDIGGTLIEDRGEVPNALISALNENGVQVSAEEIRPLRGASKREVIAALVNKRWGGPLGANETRVGTIYSRFQSYLQQAYEHGDVRAIKGAPESISWLRERGVAVSANTGFSRQVTDLILSKARLEGLLDAVITGDDVSKGRPAPYLIFRAIEQTGVTDVRRVIAVGDTPLDIQAGYNAGVRKVIGVLTGVYSSDELRKHAPTDILPSVAGLPEFFNFL
jgi:phosphonatase-like hydrolase